MTKADLVEEVTRVTELPRKESEAVVETIFESIISALQADDKIEIRGFGSFRTRERRGRTGRNPKTGAKVEVPPKMKASAQYDREFPVTQVVEIDPSPFPSPLRRVPHKIWNSCTKKLSPLWG